MVKKIKRYIEQYSAMSATTALEVPSRSSRRCSNNGSTTSISLVSVGLLPAKEILVLKITDFKMQTAPSITSSSAL